MSARGIVSGEAGETEGLDPKGKSPVGAADAPKSTDTAASHGSDERASDAVVVTQQDVDTARAIILECTGKAVLSGGGQARREDRTWVYHQLCSAAGYLTGTIAASSEASRPQTSAPGGEGTAQGGLTFERMDALWREAEGMLGSPIYNFGKLVERASLSGEGV